jgi:hypothetical protein
MRVWCSGNMKLSQSLDHGFESRNPLQREPPIFAIGGFILSVALPAWLEISSQERKTTPDSSPESKRLTVALQKGHPARPSHPVARYLTCLSCTLSASSPAAQRNPRSERLRKSEMDKSWRSEQQIKHYSKECSASNKSPTQWAWHDKVEKSA